MISSRMAILARLRLLRPGAGGNGRLGVAAFQGRPFAGILSLLPAIPPSADSLPTPIQGIAFAIESGGWLVQRWS